MLQIPTDNVGILKMAAAHTNRSLAILEIELQAQLIL
jgi:hypothetical protein